MRRGATKSFLLFLGLLILAEAILRLALPASFTGNFEYGFSPSQGFVEDAAGVVHLTPSLARDFFPQTFSKARPKGRLRIFALGDSVEYWSGFEPVLADTYPVRVAGELRTNGVDCQAINLAVVGYGSMKNQVLLRKILEYEPDLILLKVNWINEAVDEGNFARAGEFRNWRAKNWLRKTYLIQSLLVLKENLLMKRLLSHEILLRTQEPAAAAPPASQTEDGGNSRFLETLRGSVLLASENHIPIILICQSIVRNGADGRRAISDNGMEHMAAIVKDRGVGVFSFCEALQDFPAHEVFADHVHLSRYGHQQIAHALARQILRTLKKNEP